MRLRAGGLSGGTGFGGARVGPVRFDDAQLRNRSAPRRSRSAQTAGDDSFADQVWSEAIDALAIGIANYAALLDPELVVIGGGMAAAGNRLFEPLRRRLTAHVRFGEPPQIVAAMLGDDGGPPRSGNRCMGALLGWMRTDLAAWEL